ncbi:hypothetical protein L596_004459 [Steinernema carpocapsae]|uniref:Histidine acid phosphatase n=1 Tax=Steinernema carpocapsae TaxID=34508 RepID=A0A4U8UVV9_STECR|nr:hypothetical protein L596_004459 [Steinernema carpocapsae]
MAKKPAASGPCAWAPISNDNLPDLRSLIEEKKHILEYMSNHTGWNASISNAADLADNILEIDLYNATYPDWLEHPSLPNHTKESLKKEILVFGENHQIECAEYEPCRGMMAGYWLQNIVDYLQKLVNRKPTYKLIGYCSHTEITLAVMKLMYLLRSELTTSAGFVIEVREKSRDYEMRLLYHDPNPIDEHVIYQAEYAPELRNISDADNWMQVREFIDLVHPRAFSDWQARCGREAASSQCGVEAHDHRQLNVEKSVPARATHFTFVACVLVVQLFVAN